MKKEREWSKEDFKETLVTFSAGEETELRPKRSPSLGMMCREPFVPFNLAGLTGSGDYAVVRWGSLRLCFFFVCHSGFSVESGFGDEKDDEWDKNAREDGDKSKCPSP